MKEMCVGLGVLFLFGCVVSAIMLLASGEETLSSLLLEIFRYDDYCLFAKITTFIGLVLIGLFILMIILILATLIGTSILGGF